MKFITQHRSSIYLVLVAILFATYPLTLAGNSIGMGLLGIFFFLDNKKQIKQKLVRAFANKFVWLSIAFCIVQCIGLLYTENLNFGLKQLNHSLPFLILPIVALSEKINKNDYNKLLTFIKYWTVSVMLFYVVYHVLYLESPISGIADFTINSISSTSQIYTSALSLIAIIIAIKDLLKNNQIILNVSIFLFLTYIILLLSSRIVVLALLIGVIVIIYNHFKGISAFKRIALMSISILTLSVSIYNVPRIKSKIEVLYKTTDFNMDVILTKNSMTITKNTVEHRFLMYYTATKAILEALPFGYGTGDYQEVLNNGYDDIKFKIGIEEKFNTHNQYLEEFLKTGILGGFTLILLTTTLIRFVRVDDYLIFSMVVLAIIGCVFESFLARQHGVLFVAFFIPFFYNNSEISHKN